MDAYHSPTTKSLFRGTQIVWYILSLVQVSLAFRFVLKLTGANPEAGFTHAVYVLTTPLTAPFLAVFQKILVPGGIFEWTTILAMVVYWLLAVGIIRLFLMSKSVSTSEAATKLAEQQG